MDLNDLRQLRSEIEIILANELTSHSRRVVVGYPESPNPYCFFEVEGVCFAQGTFWANSEYRIEAMIANQEVELMMESGSVASINDAVLLVTAFCRRAQEIA